MSRSPTEENVFNSFASTISQAAGNISRTIGRTAVSAGELLSDGELRKKGTTLLVQEASKGIKEIQHKVGNAAETLTRGIQYGAGTLQRGIVSGNRQVQAALEQARNRAKEARLSRQLEMHQELPVDVQIGEKFYEDAPQEMRSRLWIALIQDPQDREKKDQSGQEQDLIDLHDEESESSGENKEDWEILDNPFTQSGPIPSREGTSSAVALDSESVLEAMWSIKWPVNEEISPDSKYRTLIQITIGQDEVDDVIRRDIHRTFPELPHFNYQDKCSALFNILKAYSLHDLEVGYCQGMGFVAGILLIYLPEEWAFKMFCHLMDGEKVNLRRLYLPGLEALKMELWKLEWLLGRHLTILETHFREHGVGAVLYASQWILTCFSCPFAEAFAARVVDMMMTQNSSKPLLRVAFAVLAELGPELLQQDNLEDILIQIKVKPLSWGITTIRRVMAASMDSPLTDEDIELAERCYNEIQDQQQQQNSMESEQNDLISLDSNNEQVSLKTREEQQQIMEETEEELSLMLSMDLLLDVEDHNEPILHDNKTLL